MTEKITSLYCDMLGAGHFIINTLQCLTRVSSQFSQSYNKRLKARAVLRAFSNIASCVNP